MIFLLNKENFKLKNALNSFKPLLCGFFIKKEEDNKNVKGKQDDKNKSKAKIPSAKKKPTK